MAQKETGICPVCGKKLPRFMKLELKDAVIWLDGEYDVDCIDPLDSLGGEAGPYGTGGVTCQGRGGLPCVLEFTGKGILPEPGDLVVRD